MRISEILNELTFQGSPCTKDCSGHRAGFTWNRKRGGIAPCDGSSQSFNNGCNIASNQKITRPKIRDTRGRFAQNPPTRLR